jgi:hypothetical protein
MRKNDDLKAEYLLIQGQYEAYDQRALSVKALAAPLLGAGIAVGLKDGSRSIIVATVVVAVALWALEAIWKTFQYCLTKRIKFLEGWFRGEGDEAAAPFQVYTSWVASWEGGLSRPRAALRIMGLPFVFLPYAVIAGLGIAAFVWLSF